MGKVASSVDNALIESLWSSMQSELLDRQSWTSRVELASAMFEWIEGWYNPWRRHSSLGMVSPAHFEQLDNNVMVAA
jgi:transposase InsO family protein